MTANKESDRAWVEDALLMFPRGGGLMVPHQYIFQKRINIQFYKEKIISYNNNN
jgi:hypothetical protein